ncbi:phosphate ABC transporter substrate-binding protein [Dyadobacter luteus]|jgi:phosphate transport system substrate-binding protein|uniref:Phosphate ABC transporter substrate-binding protein n=1 Tax=Dyadobacter luteus TaxID=2259619 RepID=A0A3D8Y7W5_9BACT|nr:substrate-binding domain-containing protein [Dyadobacter luteus]REA59256.1 phosphate ABC transporter substrate-binding protein [Dyadobacter luteus]
MKIVYKAAAVLIAGAFIYACSGGTENSQVDNPRRGTVTIAADESFRPLVDGLTKAYEGIYPESHFNVNYLPEQEAVLQLLQDSARLIIATRKLTGKESDIMKQQKGYIKYQHIAIDGLALVASKANSDSLITMSELRAILEGKITNWSQLPGSNQTGLITLVFDDVNASNLNFVRSKFGLKDIKNLRIIASGSNEKVIEDVRSNPLHLGFIGVNWISDGHSLKSHELSEGLNVFGISQKDNPDSLSNYYQPFQAGLEFKNYPLSRDVYIISREEYSGLGGGLMTYIARDVGGLIIQKMGLIPMIRYPRQVEIRTGKNF